MQQRHSTSRAAILTVPIHFGAFLKMLRDRHGVAQEEILKYMPGWQQPSYSKVERDTRSPTFDQLHVIYSAMAQSGIELTSQDRHQFVLLARKKIESRKTRHDRKEELDWEVLQHSLAEIDQFHEESIGKDNDQVSRRPHIVETRHLIGREEWLVSVTARLQEKSPKKLLIIQGPVGIGKSSELCRLAKQFLSIPNHFTTVFCELPPIERNVEPEGALDMLFSEILNEIGQPDAVLHASLETRIAYILSCLERAARPVLLFVDNAESVQDQQGLSWCWDRFLRQLLKWQHQATLVMATKEWNGWLEEERTFVELVTVPPLDVDAGVTLLQRLGLKFVPLALLRRLHEQLSGVPQAIEWIATLIQDPIQFDSWDVFDLNDETDMSGSSVQNIVTQRVQLVLDDPSLVGSPVATKLKPLLDRVLEQHLSPEACQVLYQLSVSNIDLGKDVVRVVCPRPSLWRELRSASLLVAYEHRVQVLPFVAAALRTRLEARQKQQLESHLAMALLDSLRTNRALTNREIGMMVTELVEIYLRHHRILDAAQLIILHMHLSFKLGHARRLAQLSLKCVDNIHQEKEYRTTSENECGEILLHYQLSSFLGHKVHSKQRAVDYQRIHDFIFADNIKLEPQIEVHIMHHLMLAAMNDLSFSEAQNLLDAYYTRFETLTPHDIDLQAALLEKKAWLFGKWGAHLEEQQFPEAGHLQEQSITLYKECAEILSQKRKLSSLEETSAKKRLGIILNGIAYRLNKLGQYEEALEYAERSLGLKEQGYVDVGALAASRGEKSQILANLGQFRQALIEDEKAFVEVEHLANEGHSPSQEELWIYRVNRGRLFLFLGRVDEAYQLLKDAPDNIHERREVFKVLAKDLLNEINAWRRVNPGPPYQLDWRWTQRYRDLISYDPYWWWAQAGPFNDEEKGLWDQLFTTEPINEKTKKQLNLLIAQSRQREITMAMEEQREPLLWYPALNITEVRECIASLNQLDNEILNQEPNALVRRLYRDAIEEEVQYLQMIEATYERNSTKFWELGRSLYPLPTAEEMQYPLLQVKHTLWEGLQCQETKGVSQQLLDLIEEKLHLTFDFSNLQDIEKLPRLEPQSFNEEKMVTVGTAQRFFSWALHENGYEGWQVVVDPKASGASVYSAQRQFVLQENDIPLSQIKHYLSHELAGHVARTVAGERSPLGILATGTKNYSQTEEGLALYNEKQTMRLCGGTFDDSGSWLGMLAVGLAAGVITPPQTFSRLYTFFELFLLIRRLLRKQDTDLAAAKKQAQKKALDRCIRTYRGVPNFEGGICFSKDVIYLRGLQMIELAVEENPTVLDQLAVGKIAKEYVGALQELELVPPPPVLRELASDPDLDDHILSFGQV